MPMTFSTSLCLVLLVTGALAAVLGTLVSPGAGAYQDWQETTCTITDIRLVNSDCLIGILYPRFPGVLTAGTLNVSLSMFNEQALVCQLKFPVTSTFPCAFDRALGGVQSRDRIEFEQEYTRGRYALGRAMVLGGLLLAAASAVGILLFSGFCMECYRLNCREGQMMSRMGGNREGTPLPTHMSPARNNNWTPSDPTMIQRPHQPLRPSSRTSTSYHSPSSAEYGSLSSEHSHRTSYQTFPHA